MNQELENVMLNIDKAFEDIKPMDYESTIQRLQSDRKKLIEALTYFTDRVEGGTARSKVTYMKFKALLSEVTKKPKSENSDRST